MYYIYVYFNVVSNFVIKTLPLMNVLKDKLTNTHARTFCTILHICAHLLYVCMCVPGLYSCGLYSCVCVVYMYVSMWIISLYISMVEGTDAWSFSHNWEGSVDIQEREQIVVKQPTLELSKRTKPPPVSDTAERLTAQYLVKLDGEWKPGQAAALLDTLLLDTLELLDTLDDLCSTSVSSKGSPASNCHMHQPTSWSIADERLVDDVHRSHHGQSIKVAQRALDYATSRGATLNGQEGNVVSRRLSFAVMRVVTDWGAHKPVVEQILKRRFGAQLKVDPSYTELTSVTTYEATASR